jgi:hypothetical protein
MKGNFVNSPPAPSPTLLQPGRFERMRLRGLSGARDELVSLAGRDLAADITFDDADARSGSMNYLRTAILLAGLTASLWQSVI